MIGKKVKLRITFLLFSFISLILIIFLVIKSLEENVVYFKSPTEVNNLGELTKNTTLFFEYFIIHFIDNKV